jgi:hypothetical protein
MHSSASSAPENRNEMLVAETAGDLSTDEVAIIFGFLLREDGFLPREDIMRLRRVCTTWRDAAKKTPVPLTDFLLVNDVRPYNAMRVMSTALPTFQKIVLRNLRRRQIFSDGEELDEEWAAQTADSITLEIKHKYNDGEDPDERLAQRTADWSTLDINIISNFRKLRILQIYNASLNGIYPSLFNFPLLQKLRIWHCTSLKWDLEMLEGLPSLKELHFVNNPRLSGNINSLRVLKDTLEKMEITACRLVEGNFMDLADFPSLKKLDLSDTAVTGDIRDIRGHDFSAVVSLSLPKGVHGGIESTEAEYRRLCEELRERGSLW